MLANLLNSLKFFAIEIRQNKSLFLLSCSHFVYLVTYAILPTDQTNSDGSWVFPAVLLAGFIGQVYWFHFVLRRMKSEEQQRLIQAQNRYLDQRMELVRTVSDELGDISTQVKKIQYDFPVVYKELLKIIERLKNRLDLIISTKLSQDGKIKESEFFDVESRISQIIEEKRLELSQVSHLHLMYRLSHPIMNEVHIPQSDFSKAISILIQNSIEAMSAQKEKRINFILTPQESQLTLLIQDNGPGISEDLLPRLFGRSSAKGDKPQGLSQARKIIEEWGGALELKRTGAQGTVFEMRLKFKNQNTPAELS